MDFEGSTLRQTVRIGIQGLFRPSLVLRRAATSATLVESSEEVGQTRGCYAYGSPGGLALHPDAGLEDLEPNKQHNLCVCVPLPLSLPGYEKWLKRQGTGYNVPSHHPCPHLNLHGWGRYGVRAGELGISVLDTHKIRVRNGGPRIGVGQTVKDREMSYECRTRWWLIAAVWRLSCPLRRALEPRSGDGHEKPHAMW